MLTHGLEKFKEYFNGFKNQYVLIGRTACSILFDEFGLTPCGHKSVLTTITVTDTSGNPIPLSIRQLQMKFRCWGQ